jgi:TolB-like protein/Tfp pilus assembly protein PilF
MSSLVSSFEYDVFISYRQKDNKHDGWVTGFVNQLKGELESTFKEEISVYFDINPHDGLLETHDVDASLKEKLKCAVFIPIISHTYCDPKSFAWEHEFKTFAVLASRDVFGLKIKLPNGNVANRILPVLIHDLDSEDKNLIENELKCVLRGIEFIYKEPGVNRPLTPTDDDNKNINKIKYRNQINKVANAIREIINGMRSIEKGDKESGPEINKETATKKHPKIRIIAGGLLIFGLLMIGYLIIPKLFRPVKQHEKSIAVLPFHNYSEESNQEYMSDGLTDEIINHLYKIRSFDKVVPTSSVITYKGSAKKISQIANELNVNYILEGTYKKIGQQIRVSAKLVDPNEDKYLWQHEYDKPYNEIIAIQADIALQIADQLQAYLTSSEKENIRKVPTINPQAYELMQQAQYLWIEKGFNAIDEILELFLKIIKLDPDYADAHAWAGMFILLKGAFWGGNEMRSVAWDAESYFEKALELDQNSSAAHFGMAWFNNWIKWNYVNAQKEFLKALELEPNNPLYYQYYADFLIQKNQLNEPIKEAVARQQYLQIIQIKILTGNKKDIYSYIKKYLASGGSSVQKQVGECYIWMGEYDSARIYLENSIRLKDPQMLISRYQAELALVYHKTNQSSLAQKIINQQIIRCNINASGSQGYFIGWYYSGIGDLDSAFYWLEKAYQGRSPEFSWLKVDPVFTSLKKDPRYWDLYKRTGHKAYDDYIAETGKK